MAQCAATAVQSGPQPPGPPGPLGPGSRVPPPYPQAPHQIQPGGYDPPPWEPCGGVRPATVRTLSGWAQGLLWVNFAALVLLVLVGLLELAVVADYHAGGATAGDVDGMNVAVGLVLAIVWFPPLIASIVLWCVWQHHVHRQLVALRRAIPVLGGARGRLLVHPGGELLGAVPAHVGHVGGVHPAGQALPRGDASLVAVVVGDVHRAARELVHP